MEYNLLIKAALQGCTNLQLHGGFNNPNSTYRIKVKCKRCQEENVIEMSLGHVPTSSSTSRKTNSSKSPVHFDGQCDIKSCAQKIWAQMIPGCGAPYARNSKVEYKEIMKFKFGGAKPVGFIFGGG
ncbi:Uncharacterized protein TCM_028988 [Theobroma cacao]|uniref:Uncharacterized protein n=1 Tax=Theobroma cacao TaxID=3641 RepID=A0A061GAW5_THECC|nr:Uncharacterized protein TCM_028988 [Theobroma cacao]